MEEQIECLSTSSDASRLVIDAPASAGYSYGSLRLLKSMPFTVSRRLTLEFSVTNGRKEKYEKQKNIMIASALVSHNCGLPHLIGSRQSLGSRQSH